MALVNTHPDNLADRTTLQVYVDFLKAMQNRSGHWNAIPADVARWWRARGDAPSVASLPGATQSAITLSGAAPDSSLESVSIGLARANVLDVLRAS